MHKKPYQTHFILQHQSEIIIENRLNICLFAFKNHQINRNLVQNGLGDHIGCHGNTNCKSCILIFVSTLNQLCTCLYITAKTTTNDSFLVNLFTSKNHQNIIILSKMASVAICVAMAALTVHNVY